MSQIEKVALAHLPTPLEQLPRLTQALGGPDIWIKRDDMTGLALGGNKTRKLEYLLGDALAHDADCIITAGAPQSNHCRQTAAAAAKLGLECHLLLGGSAHEQGNGNGNVLLDTLLGAHLYWSGDQRRGESLDSLSEKLKQQGRTPYVVPYGGSNVIGALGYVNAMKELAEQQGPDFGHIVFASCSGGTHAGMIVGRALTQSATQILGIRIDKKDPQSGPYPEVLAELTTQTAQHVGVDISPDAIQLNNDYMGGGYAVLGEQEKAAIELLAQTEGILLDPVYSGRAFAGFVELIKQGYFPADEPLLFWHTGGQPALFAYNDALSSVD